MEDFFKDHPVPRVHDSAQLSTSFPADMMINPAMSLQSLVLLRELLKNNDAEFKSPSQHLAADLIIHTRESGICVLPTGSGKALLAFLACIADTSRSVLLVVPTIALQEDLVERAEASGITTCIDISQYSSQSLLIFTVEHAVSLGVLAALIGIANGQNKLWRIFIDEAHCILNDTYRSQMGNLVFLVRVAAPVILLTATLSLAAQGVLMNSFFGSTNQIIVRSPSNRPNIALGVQIYDGTILAMKKHILAVLRTLQRPDRIIVFFNSIGELESFKSELGQFSVGYHAEMTKMDRRKSVHIWKEGSKVAMLATSAFGIGVDFPSVRHVLIVGLPYSVEDFIQQAGRAGRDGDRSECTLFWSENAESRREIGGSEVRLAQIEMVKKFASSSTCRRVFLSSIVDSETISCIYSKNNVKCDNCVKISGSIVVAPKSPAIAGPSISKDSHRMEDLMATIDRTAKRLAILLVRLRGTCPFCFASDSRMINRDHDLNHCPYMRYRCLRCASRLGPKNHPLKDCPLKIIWPAPGCCNRCLLPKERLGTKFHEDHQFGNSMCPNVFLREYLVAKYAGSAENFLEFYTKSMEMKEPGGFLKGVMFCLDKLDEIIK